MDKTKYIELKDKRVTKANLKKEKEEAIKQLNKYEKSREITETLKKIVIICSVNKVEVVEEV